MDPCTSSSCFLKSECTHGTYLGNGNKLMWLDLAQLGCSLVSLHFLRDISEVRHPIYRTYPFISGNPRHDVSPLTTDTNTRLAMLATGLTVSSRSSSSTTIRSQLKGPRVRRGRERLNTGGGRPRLLLRLRRPLGEVAGTLSQS